MGDFKMDEYTYSIIIPHKNSPLLLRKCLDSIPNQDDIQIIVVDDNSDSGKVDFSCFPGVGKHNTEVYFTKEGKGAGYARNVGMKYAKGRWLLFADADDYFTEGFVSDLNDYKDSEYDIVFFGTTSVYPETGEPAMRHIFLEELLYKAILSKNYDCLKYKRFSPVAKIVRRSLVVEFNICFDEVIVSNDAMFAIRTGHHAKKVFADSKVIYVITVQKGSLEYTASENFLRCRLQVAHKINDYYKLNHINERVNIMDYIIQFRAISTKLFFINLLYYSLKNPVRAIRELFSTISNYTANRKKISRNVVKKNKSYILKRRNLFIIQFIYTWMLNW